MPRVPLIHPDTSPQIAELAQRVCAERGGKLLQLYQVLLHSPPVAEAWLSFFTAIRQRCTLSAKYRELAILSVAKLNRATYEFDQHVPFALNAGLTQGQIDAVENWRSTIGLFGDIERAVLQYTEAMTRSIQVPNDYYQAIDRSFTAQEVVELTATIAGYNMVSRFLEAMRIEHE